MKKVLLIMLTAIAFASCKSSSLHSGGYHQLNQTQIVLSNNNFEVLGSFTGTATEKILTGNITNKEGIVSQAKSKMLENAKDVGIVLLGSRALVNVSVDITETKKRITATVTAEIIEFK
ncbi:DUF6567 family protein [Winogradskyella eximia]|uniref:DUF6567 family protein n=1 Tax=Winogradskyella eximia TaxID=262006 RepID=UPI0024907D48|nr:DUF6567 family protein [Winogradskyella eximia]